MIDNPSLTVIRLEADLGGRLENRTPANMRKPTTSGNPNTTKSESVQVACDTARLRKKSQAIRP